MEDIAPKLLKDLNEDFEQELEKRTKKYNKCLDKKTSDYQTAHDYSLEVNKAFKYAINKNINSETLPDGKMYFNIAEKTVKPLMERSYNEVAEFSVKTQQIINEKNEIGLKALKPTLKQDRVDNTISYISNQPDFEMVRQDLFDTNENILQSTVDESVRVNADSHYHRGLNPIIKRIAVSDCCKWCQNLAGTYKYEEVKNTGNDVFRRHKKCKCLVLYSSDSNFKNVVNAHNKQNVDYEKINEQYLNQHKKGDKVSITDQSIDKVKECGPASYSKENLEYTKQCRRELLELSKNENNSNETSCLIDLTKNVRSEFVKGDKDSVNLESNSMCYNWLRKKEKNSLEITHNHPGLSYFSLNDINFFMNHSSVRTMSIVTNQGKVWYISKTQDFDIQKAKLSMLKTFDKAKNYEKNKNDKIVELFLKDGYTYGVERN